jgi:hypothetical protein
MEVVEVLVQVFAVEVIDMGMMVNGKASGLQVLVISKIE